jgi:hypothetical protein
MEMKRHFQRFGRGVYNCAICARKTREAGQGNDHLCPECYELAGWENSVLDGGSVEEVAAERDRLLAKAVSQGSDEARMRKSFVQLWAGRRNK